MLTKLPKIFSEVNSKIGTLRRFALSYKEMHVDFRLSVVKPLGARLFKRKPDIVRNGFKEAGIVNCLNTDE